MLDFSVTAARIGRLAPVLTEPGLPGRGIEAQRAQG